ncbi:MAG TPA: right-handed parallel beta-helix repeat-containing protein [Planctomycetota bacterium]|nr:right-handed parallel beta-helix repeat-containing protein [Planctomycetota bacterium]
MTRTVLIGMLCVMLCIACRAQEGTGVAYYVSSSQGDDSRSAAQAKNPATPWKSISKLNSSMSLMSPGDAILFKRGDVFHGTLRVSKSGTSETMPMIFGAYGTGNNPKLTGLVNLSSWTLVRNGIYSTPLKAGAFNLVLLNGVVQAIGRYPNTGYLNLEAHSDKVDYKSITDEQLPASPSWTGAEVVIRKRRWILDRQRILNHSGITIQYAPTLEYYGNSNAYAPTDKNGYFFQNHLSTLDKPGEWYYDSKTALFYMHFGSLIPSSQVVQVSTSEYNATVLSHSFVTFRGIDFEGSNKAGLMLTGTRNITVTNCNFVNHGRNGIYGTNLSYVNVDGGSVNNTLNNGIQFEVNANNSRISRVNVSNIGMIAGMGGCGDGAGQGIHVSGNGNIIDQNRVTNCGYNAIAFFGNYVLVEKNFIDSFCIVKDDGGGIYTFTGGVGGGIGRKIANNVILHGIGASAGAEGDIYERYPKAAGIYLDQESEGVEISGNSVAHGPWGGIFVHRSRNIQITNNTIYDCLYQLHFVYSTNTCRNVTRYDNKFVARYNWQHAIYNRSYYNESPALTGNSNNNIITKPIDEATTLRVEIDGLGANPYLSLAQWQALYGQDLGSRTAGKTISDPGEFRFEYNETGSTKTVTLDATYVGVDGTYYGSTVTLNPYSSVVMLRTQPQTVSVQKLPLAGMLLWLKADAINLAPGTAIASWVDSSGNNRHATNNQTPYQPVFVANVQNGLPSVRFDGQKFLRLPGGFNEFSTGMTAFTVVRAQATPNSTFSGIFWCNNTVDERSAPNNGAEASIYPRWERVDHFGILEDYDNQNWSFEVWNTTPIIPVPEAPGRLAAGQWSAINNAGGFKYNVTRLNTVVQRGGTPGRYSPLTRTYMDANLTTPAATSTAVQIPTANFKNYCYIGCREETGSRFIGDMHEIILYNRELSDAERVVVQKYLCARWGLSAPFAEPDTAVTKQGTAVICNVLANDFFGKNVQVQVTQPASGGTVAVLADNTVRVVPSANFSGVLTFKYTLRDLNTALVSSAAFVDVTVRAATTTTSQMTKSLGTESSSGPVAQQLVLVSGPTAETSPAMAGEPVRFIVAFEPADAEVTWDFGDGSIEAGAITSHTFAAAGSYNIHVTAALSSNDQLSQALTLTVVAPGHAEDSSDMNAIEAAQLVAPLALTKLAIKLNFISRDKDALELQGEVPARHGAHLSGKNVRLSIGGVTRELVLNSRGEACGPGASFKVVFKNGRPARFRMRSIGSFAEQLAASGLTNSDVRSLERWVRVSLDIDGVSYQVLRRQIFDVRGNGIGLCRDTK